MIKHSFNPVFWVIIILFVSCHPKVVSFVNDDVPFSRYQSYTILNLKSGSNNNSSEGKQTSDSIEYYLDLQMLKRAYVSSRTKPDVVLRYELISNLQTERVNNQSFFSPTAPITNRTTRQSALLLELNDFDSKRIVWQASIDLNQYDRKRRKFEILKSAIDAMFNTYLYKANSRVEDISLINQ